MTQHFFCLAFLFTSLSVIAAEAPVPIMPPLDQDNNIRHYLMREAAEVTAHSMDSVNTSQDWQAVREQKYAEMVEMLSLTDVPLTSERPPLNMQVVGEIKQDGFKIVKLYYESLPKLYVPADLYIPDNITQPVPGILYVCGHARTQKVHYQAHPRKFAQLGFVCLIIETIQWGEVQGHHWGCYSEGRFNWYSRGYTPGGVETWNSIRGLDLLGSLPEVDKNKLGVTGISGGGSTSWYVGAIDPRVTAVAPVCGNGTVEGQVCQRNLDGHCDCMMPINTYLIDFPNLAALIAPRPLLVAAADGDGLYSIESIRQAFDSMKKFYEMLGAGDVIDFVETPGGHSYHEKSRTRIFSFFIKHLMGKDIPPEKVGDIDEREEAQLSVEDLRIFKNGMLPDDRTLTIQDTFQKMAEPPVIENEADLKRHRADVIDFLKERTFRAFPKEPVDLDWRMVFRDKEGQGGSHVYAFIPEEGYRLKVECHWTKNYPEKRPLLLVLRSPDEQRWDSEGFVSGVDTSSLAFLEVRGIGETGWAPELQWHVRRASAWTGRTVASMRVYDVLRCLQGLRQVEGIDPERISIAARGEMGVIALYAALLDGHVDSVLVENLPATQDKESAKDGRGEALEMLNCLRVTDIPQVAGMLHPTKVNFVGQPPETYNWAIEMAKAIGKPEGVRVIQRVRDWQREE